MGNGKECSICCSEYTTDGEHRIVAIKCGHVFGKSCLNKWIRESKNRKCPTCQNKIKKSDIRPLFVDCLEVVDNKAEEEVLIQLRKEQEENNHLSYKYHELQYEYLRQLTEMSVCQRGNKYLTTVRNMNVVPDHLMGKKSNVFKSHLTKIKYDHNHHTVVISCIKDDHYGLFINSFNSDLFAFIKFNNAINDFDLSTSSDTDAVVAVDKQIHLINLGSQNTKHIFNFENKITAVTFSKNNDFIVVGDISGQIFTVDITKLEIKLIGKVKHAIIGIEKIIQKNTHDKVKYFIATIFQLYEMYELYRIDHTQQTINLDHISKYEIYDIIPAANVLRKFESYGSGWGLNVPDAKEWMDKLLAKYTSYYLDCLYGQYSEDSMENEVDGVGRNSISDLMGGFANYFTDQEKRNEFYNEIRNVMECIAIYVDDIKHADHEHNRILRYHTLGSMCGKYYDLNKSTDELFNDEDGKILYVCRNKSKITANKHIEVIDRFNIHINAHGIEMHTFSLASLNNPHMQLSSDKDAPMYLILPIYKEQNQIITAISAYKESVLITRRESNNKINIQARGAVKSQFNLPIDQTNKIINKIYNNIICVVDNKSKALLVYHLNEHKLIDKLFVDEDIIDFVLYDQYLSILTTDNLYFYTYGD